MAVSLNKFEQVRVDKIPEIEKLGHDPWGQRYENKEAIASLRDRVPPVGTTELPPARTAGRIVGLRDGGKVLFIDLQDSTAKIQLFVSKKQLGEEGWKLAQLFDLWDIVGVDGKLGHTKTGEITVFADRVEIMCKTIAHPPDKFHGMEDIELRLRRRYVDMVQDVPVLRKFEMRAKMLRAFRDYFHSEGFVEVETPTMQAIAGGAAARPFITHHNALDIDLYMRIAPELYLKRLLVGGMERVFEIGRMWRNEGIDASHNPEFTMLELYEAFGNYHRMMELTEGAIVAAATSLGNGLKIPYGEKTIDLTPPFRRASYDDLLKEHAGVSMDDEAGVLSAAQKRGIPTAGKHPDVVVSQLFEATVEDALDGPVFVIDYPATLCPLTKRKRSNPRVAERFELFAAGMEMANAYTELTDPILQEELFAGQLAGQKEEDSMAKMDRDFITALRHGMPPAGGLGIGIDRLAMLLTNSQTIRDVIAFPLLRPQTNVPQAATSDPAP